MKITKKQIEKILRTQNSTEIFKLAKMCGVDVKNKINVCLFIRDNAPCQRVYRNAYKLSVNADYLKHQRAKITNIYMPIRDLVNYVREQKKLGESNYAKMLIVGNKNIYWASPNYQHSDYNKGIAMPNNEKNRELAKKINKMLGYN